MVQGYEQQVIEFVHQNESWAAPVAFFFAFGESLALISPLFPGWAVLIGLGALMGLGGVGFWLVWIAASIGAAGGDWLSYWLGHKFRREVYKVWPLSRHPELGPKSEAFVAKWGVAGIFVGRFFGPFRAFVPLVAGVMTMPYWRFQAANVISSFVWAGVTLGIGNLGIGLFSRLS